MKPITNYRARPSPKPGRILLALSIAAIMGVGAVAPALGEDNDHRDEHQNGWRGDAQHRSDRHDDRGRHDQRYRHYEYQQPHYYNPPIYTPPPVYYPREQSPGVSLFLPFDFRSR
jgi:hypothetical protein